MSEIFFTSDSHYFHGNISGPTVSKWKAGYRNFSSAEEMNETIVNSFNSVVGKNAIVYHLGDFAYGLNNVYQFRGKMQCKELHLILGNHDKDIRKNKNSIRGIFNSVQDVLKLKTGKHQFFLSHYAHLVWPSSHRGVLHLFGHSHNNLDKRLIRPRSMDVGIDAAYARFGEYRPFHIDEVIEILDKQKIDVIDHHHERD